jgi:heme/copper-type cytochrome/quinol oxidase subunit 2
MIAMSAIGIGIGWGFGSTVSPTPLTTNATATKQGESSPFMLNLIEPMDNAWPANMSVAQPMFLVSGPKGLESSANISLPANALIQVNIVSYDTPTPGSTAQEGKVNGTLGGTIYLINGTVASMADTSMIQMSGWGGNVTSVPASQLAHTFSIPQLGINIPVVGGSEEIAYLYFKQPGVYTWACLTPCGLGSNGTQGAMSTNGWMTGQITVR